MTSVIITCAEADIEQTLALAAFANLAGVEETADGRLRLWLNEEGEAEQLCERLAAWSPAVERTVVNRNWNETWQSGWRPMEAGERFYLTPPGDNSPTPAGRIRLEMHPGTAFGNGDHATTHLCLMAMERQLRPGDRFLDIGCASGLLGEAALALGAGQAHGCDLDAAAVRRGHFIGSVNAVQSASCDFVVANIQLGVLLGLLAEIARILRPGARAVLSGVLEAQVEELSPPLTQVGLERLTVTCLDGWAALTAGPLWPPRLD